MSRAFRIGLFVVCTLVVLGVGVFLIGSKQYLFRPTYRLTADFDDASGLNNGAEVRIAGIHAGTVQRIELPQRPGDKVTLVMRLDRGTRNILRTDSVATIETEGLLGDKYVEISVGSENAASVDNGGSIRGQTPPDLSAKASQAIGQIGSAVGTFQDDAEALKHNFLLRGFFKKRGYYDQSQLAADRIAQLPEARPVKEFSYDTSTIFGRKSGAQLTGRRVLNDAGKFLQQNPFQMAVVAVPAPSDENNQQRIESEARAKVVSDYLAQNFKLDEGRIKVFAGSAAASAAQGADKMEIMVYGPKAPA